MLDGFSLDADSAQALTGKIETGSSENMQPALSHFSFWQKRADDNVVPILTKANSLKQLKLSKLNMTAYADYTSRKPVYHVVYQYFGHKNKLNFNHLF